MIKERISFVIPLAMDNNKSGTPVLIYEMPQGSHVVDLAFGVFFIGLRAGKDYSLGFDVFNENETPIPIDSKKYNNHIFFNVAEANDGEVIVSASMKNIFRNISINTPGIFEVRASLVDPKSKDIIDVKSSYFDVKSVGAIRNEFR
nr:MAG TPA_asm: hypothetical protein [Caudoviricetes sp.]